MKRSTTRWTSTLAAVVLLGMPAAGWAQAGTAAGQQPPTATATTQQPSQPGDHLRAAKAALAAIDENAVSGRTKTQLAELKRHVTALDTTTGMPATPGADWATSAAAVDRILGEMLSPTAGTGTSGSGTATGSVGAAVEVDDATRAKLMDVRTHVTKFAAAKSGTRAEPSSPAQTGSSAAGTTTAEPAPAQPPAPATVPNAPQPSAAGQVDTEAARRHLSEARTTLTEMTQLPAAATLAGDTRTHVTALISNFNELITNTTDWRSSHQKVDANLTALLGPDDAMTPAATPPVTGTAGAVGTSGTETEALDPALRGKLSELRAKLKEFERAMGGAATSGGATAMDAPAAATNTGTTSGSATSSTTTPPAANQHAMHAGAAGNADALQHIAAIEAMLNGSAPAGTATGTAGSAANPSSPSTTAGQPLTLSRTQVEQLRTHLAALKTAIEKK